MTTKTKREPGVEITAYVSPTHSGLYQVTVIHRFDSGNFVKKVHENQSIVAAQALLHFYTS